MRKKLIILVALQCLLFFTLYHFSHGVAHAANDSRHPSQTIETIEDHIERTNALLQTGLTLFEMEQEIVRLAQQEALLANEMKDVEQQIPMQQERVELMKERAAQVLRSYYLGERDNLLLLVLSVSSFSEALAAFEFIQTIVRSDQKKMLDYQEALDSLQALQFQLTEAEAQLNELKGKLISQRDEMLAMQTDFEAELEQHDDAASILEQIEQLTKEWQDKGLPAFRIYFQALADAMNHLSDIQSMYSNVISFRGTNIQFLITDEQLNAFLVSQDDLFTNLQFHFQDGYIEAMGEHEGMHLYVKGQFSLEDEPRNKMSFHIDELQYNDFILPESTMVALEEEFNLAFYPDQISFLGFTFKATELHMEPDSLRVILKFN